MADLQDPQSLQELISSITEEIVEKIDELLEESTDLDIINNVQQLAIFEEKFPIPSDFDESPTGLKFVYDVAMHGALSDFINQRASDNGQNYKQIALLIDLSFYYNEKNVSVAHGPLNLLQRLFVELPSEWLLKFWSYIHHRTPYIKQTEPNLIPIKTPGLSLIIAINTRMSQLNRNNEPGRDILRARLLHLTTELFPTFNTLLINKTYDTNLERVNETQFQRTRDKSSVFNCVWELQQFFQDPYYPVDRNQRRNSKHYVFQNLQIVFDAIKSVETSLHGPFTKKGNEADTDNRIEVYHRDDLSEEQKKNLREFYDNKEFNPTFFISEEKFNHQLKNDEMFRRVILQQLLVVVSFVDVVIHRVPFKPKRDLKPLNPKLLSLQDGFNKSQERQFFEMKRDIYDLFSQFEKRQFYGNRQMLDLSESYFINQKSQLFADFISEFSSLEYDDKLKEAISKRDSFKPRFWAAYGTVQITRHWKEPTGLDILRKDGSVEWKKEIENNLEILRTSIKQENAKDLNTWKALRLARKSNLFKFKHANEETGIEGLYDPSIKKVQDEIKQKEEEERQKAEAILRDERLKKREEDEKAAEEQKKRKASEEISEEARKKAKQTDDPPQTSESTDLDY